MIKKEDEQKNAPIQNGNSGQSPYTCGCLYKCDCLSQDFDSTHDPFLIRTRIVVSGVVAGILGSFFAWSLVERGPGGWYFLEYYPVVCYPLLGLAFYFCCVTFGDFVSHFVLKLKSSSFSDEEKLSKDQGVTKEELDHYFDTRRNIRFVSFSIAASVLGLFLSFAPAYALYGFCLSYLVSTILGILVVRRFSNRKHPQIIRRDRRYDNPPWHRPTRPEAYMFPVNHSRWERGETGSSPFW